MSLARRVERVMAARRGAPVGYVLMVGAKPRGMVRATRVEALRDAVEAREASVCTHYGAIFAEPLTWVAPIYP